MKNPFRRTKAELVVPPMPAPAAGIAMTTIERGQKTTAPDGRLVTELPPAFVQMIRLYGLGTSYAQMYARQPNVRACVDCVAREGAGLTIKMYEKIPREAHLPSERIEISEHSMAQLLADPTPGESVYRFWFGTFADIEIFDLAIWRKVRGNGPNAAPTALLRTPPQQLFPQRDPRTGVVSHWLDVLGQRVENSELVVFWGYDPDINHGAVSPMETLRRQLAEEWASGMNREGMWKNSLRKDGIIEQDLEAEAMSDAARESFLLDVADTLAGAGNSGIPLMLQPGQHWKDSVWSPREMEYIQSRRLSRLEAAAQFHIPPAMVSANLNGVEADAATLNVFYSSSLPPRLQRIEDEIEAQLLPDFDRLPAMRRQHYVEFNLDAKLRGSFEQQAAIAATAVGGPFVTVNEMRARLNLPPLEGGDEIFIPLNSLRGGGPQGSPQAPTATPAAGIEPPGTTPGGGVTSASVGEAAELRAEMDAVDRKARASQAAREHAAFVQEERGRYEERAARQIEKLFARQLNAVKGGKDVLTERWNRELSDELFGLAYQAVDVFGKDAADRINGEWSTERTANFLRVNCDTSANSVNESSKQQLEDGADPETVFGEGRAAQLARTRTTFVVNWSVQEAAHQNGA